MIDGDLMVDLMVLCSSFDRLGSVAAVVYDSNRQRQPVSRWLVSATPAETLSLIQSLEPQFDCHLD